MSMISSVVENILPNPIDLAEQVMMDRDWAFDRSTEEELVAEVVGVWCNYRIWLNWNEQVNALVCTCALDTKLPKHQRAKIYPLLAQVNERIWIGHFNLLAQDGTVVFQYSHLLHGDAAYSAEPIDQILDIAVQECERFYPAFQAVVWGGKTAEEAMGVALFDTVGEA